MVGVANRGIQLSQKLTPDKRPQWWVAFCVFRAVALKDLGRYQAALDEMEKLLVATELEDTYKATPYYNAACYACLLYQEDKALVYLERAIYLDLKYKASAKSETDFRKLWDNPGFQQLVA